MRKIFSVDKTENYTLCLLEHRFLEICDHFFISFSLDRMKMNFTNVNLVTEKVTKENIHFLRYSGFNYNVMRQYRIDLSDPVDGFIFFTSDTHQPVGCIWVMYRGGNEAQYRIRYIDAFGFYFSVFPKFRGNRYIEYFIYQMLNHLKSKGIDKLYASVRKNNTAALKAYQRAGMKIEAEKIFYRLIRWRIPYPVV